MIIKLFLLEVGQAGAFFLLISLASTFFLIRSFTGFFKNKSDLGIERRFSVSRIVQKRWDNGVAAVTLVYENWSACIVNS